ncbi:MAG: hypothetical protein QM770_05790 [Tepidisphaeraceae bacterium]
MGCYDHRVRLRGVIAILLVLMVTFVTSGAARTIHEALDHRQLVDSHREMGDVERDACAIVASGESDVPCPADHPPSGHHGHEDQHCLLCQALAALGKLTHAPPLVAALIDQAVLSARLLPPSDCTHVEPIGLNLAAPRGPPIG